MVQRTPGMLPGDDQAARQAAAEAAALAQNARGMAASVRDRVTALENAPAPAKGDPGTPGQKGDPGAPGSSVKGDKGDPGSPVVIASGQAKTAALLALGTSADLVVTLSRAMPTTTYAVEIIPISTGLIPGAASIAGKSQTKTTVTLTVTATLAVAASSIVSVLAWGSAS